MQSCTSGLSYVGSWANGTINGWGVVTFANGERYVGEVKDHKANGYGIRTWNSGDRYEGELKDGARNGYGVYTWANGRWFEGEWKYGKPNGQGTKYDSDGRMLQSGLWKDGTFVKGTQTPPTTETVFSVNDAVYKAGVTTATSMTMEKMYGSIVDYQVQFIFSAVTETATTIEVSVPINIWLDDIGGSADTSWTATTVFNKSTGEIISFHVDK